MGKALFNIPVPASLVSVSRPFIGALAVQSNSDKGYLKMKIMKVSKTQQALDLIKYDFAKNGKDTGIASNAYIENRISYAKFQEAASFGLARFKRENQ